MKKFLFFCFFLIVFDSNAEQKHALIASVNNSIITVNDVSNEIELIKILNKNVAYNDETLKQAALKNVIDEILKSSEIKKKNLESTSKEFVDRQYNQLIKRLLEGEEDISDDIKNKIYQKIKLDYEWNDIITQKYSWLLSVNMNEIGEKLRAEGNKAANPKELLIAKENLIMNEKNKKLNIYSTIYLEKLKTKALIKFF
tara:strand:+ start:2493 stop:3089 length:597 start_codon:yes stop_codon:yes gene_type:complete